MEQSISNIYADIVCCLFDAGTKTCDFLLCTFITPQMTNNETLDKDKGFISDIQFNVCMCSLVENIHPKYTTLNLCCRCRLAMGIFVVRYLELFGDGVIAGGCTRKEFPNNGITFCRANRFHSIDKLLATWKHSNCWHALSVRNNICLLYERKVQLLLLRCRQFHSRISVERSNIFFIVCPSAFSFSPPLCLYYCCYQMRKFL